MIKVIKKYTEVSMIILSIALLQISNLFQWDNNPIMGMDKVCADILIIVLCCLLIKKMGIQSGAGFIKKGFFKGILYGIPFFVIAYLLLGASVCTFHEPLNDLQQDL